MSWKEVQSNVVTILSLTFSCSSDQCTLTLSNGLNRPSYFVKLRTECNIPGESKNHPEIVVSVVILKVKHHTMSRTLLNRQLTPFMTHKGHHKKV